MKLTRIRNQIKYFFEFLGLKVALLFFVSAAIGVLWFFVEISFVYILQLFLISLGLLQVSMANLPSFMSKPSLKWSVILMLVFGLARAVVMMLKYYFGGVTNQVFIKEFREKIVRYSLKNSAQENSAMLLEMFTTKVSGGGEVLNQVSMVINLFCSMVLISAFAFYQAPKEFLLSSVLLALALPFYFKINALILTEGSDVNRTWENTHSRFHLSLKNAFVLKIYNQADREISKLESMIQDLENGFKKFYFLNALKIFIPVASGILVVSLVTSVSVKLFHTDPIRLVGFFYLFLRIAQMASDFNNALGGVTFYRDAFALLRQFIMKIDRAELSVPKKLFSERVKTFAFDQIFFSFGKAPLIENLNVSANAGDLLLIKGQSGKGKSTILHILAGMLRPQSGAVTINGLPLDADVSIANRIAYVGPEPFLIPGTVRENLLYGNNFNGTLGDGSLIEVVKLVGLHDLVTGNPEGLNYPLLDQAQWSTGQKQRLAIARAILRDFDILIFDEATANLDVSTESSLIHNIFPYRKDKIFVVVSHRSSFDSIATVKIDL